MQLTKLTAVALLFVSLNSFAEGESSGSVWSNTSTYTNTNTNTVSPSYTNTNTNSNSSTGVGGAGGGGGNVSISNQRNAATAYAGTVYPTAMCMGSSSGGIQSAVFGFSAASSWTDKNCMVLEQARAAATVIGDKAVAEEIMCGLKEYREARARTGNLCAADKK